MKPEDTCPNCGAEFKDKYMIRVDHDKNRPMAKRHFTSTSKKSVVGWIKFICNNFGFEEIQIYNLLTECQDHEAYWKAKKAKTLEGSR